MQNQGLQDETPPVKSPAARLYETARAICVVLSIVCLVLLLSLIASVVGSSAKGSPWAAQPSLQAASGAPANPQSGTPVPLTSDQKLQLQQDVSQAQNALVAEIRADDANERAILDRLVTLVGVYSAILGLTAFFTVRFAREDALAQMDRISRDLESYKTGATRDLTNFKTNALAEVQAIQDRTRTQLEELTKNTQAQLESFKTRIWSELPEMRNLKESLRELLVELERSIPPSVNSNVETAYGSLNEAQRQKILISEGTINALQVFVREKDSENKEPLARIYHSLARFYFGRYRKEQGSIADAERADVYADRSLKLQPGNAYAYVLRGALSLSRYTLLKPLAVAADKRAELLQLLQDAQSFLVRAQEINPDDVGAAYNLALVYSWQENLPDAVKTSRQALAQRDKLSLAMVRKYIPSLTLNLACYLALQVRPGMNAAEGEQLREEAVAVVLDGADFLRKTDGSAFQSLIADADAELTTKDLRSLSAEQKQRIREGLAAEQVAPPGAGAH